MKQPSELTPWRSAVLVIALLVLASGCASRYRLDLYLTVEGDRRHIEVESTQFVWGAALGNPYAGNKLDEGVGYVAIATIGTRQAQGKKSLWRGFSSDEYLRCQLYMELPPDARPDTIVLAGKSLVHLLGRYALPIEERVFLPKDGFFILDSITDESLFFSVDGTFANKSGELLRFDGAVKIDQN